MAETESTRNDLLRAALWYARQGWPVHPLHDCASGRCSCGNDCGDSAAKHPRLLGWQHKATTDTETIRAWWARWPDANIGIATGEAALVVVDVDAKNGALGPESWRDIRADLGLNDDTPTAETPTGGTHVYYSANGGRIRNSTSKLGPGLDVRAGGGYVVAPPSKTPQGEYGWALGMRPTDIEVLPLPEPLAALLVEPERGNGHHSGREPGDLLAEMPKAASALSRLSLERCTNYESWLEVGMALSELGAPGLGLWEQWSQQAPNYEPGVCAEKWPSFTPGDGITLASLHHWAKEDSPDTSDNQPPQPFKPSDQGNAERLLAAHGDDLLYCEPLGGWMIWDGQRWTLDRTGQVERWAQETARSIYAEAAACDDPDQRARLAKHALASESANRRRGMLDQTWPHVAVIPEAFDADPWLFNTKNGTLDLRTGQLREHRREDMITKLAPIDFDADATDPIFERYLADTTGGDAGFARYLQLAAGYTLTGRTDAEDVFLVLGPGATGKSTLLEGLLAMLGDYAVKASFETFLAQRHNGGPRPDVVRMRGARMVAAVEGPKGRKLAEAEVKEMTGGDSVTARDLYRSSITFKPEFKLWLATNYAPTMDDEDTALWRRIKELPFEHVIPEEAQDPEIKRHLSTPEGGRALLAWAVKGCLAWQREGLKPCARVREATAALRAEFDPIAEFLDTFCVIRPGAEAAAKELRQAYEAWAAEMGAKTIHNKEWGRRLREKGCESLRTTRGGVQLTIWRGIGLAQLAQQTAFSEKPPREGDIEKVTKIGVCTASTASAVDHDAFNAALDAGL